MRSSSSSYRTSSSLSSSKPYSSSPSSSLYTSGGTSSSRYTSSVPTASSRSSYSSSIPYSSYLASKRPSSTYVSSSTSSSRAPVTASTTSSSCISSRPTPSVTTTSARLSRRSASRERKVSSSSSLANGRSTSGSRSSLHPLAKSDSRKSTRTTNSSTTSVNKAPADQDSSSEEAASDSSEDSDEEDSDDDEEDEQFEIVLYICRQTSPTPPGEPSTTTTATKSTAGLLSKVKSPASEEGEVIIKRRRVHQKPIVYSASGNKFKKNGKFYLFAEAQVTEDDLKPAPKKSRDLSSSSRTSSNGSSSTRDPTRMRFSGTSNYRSSAAGFYSTSSSRFSIPTSRTSYVSPYSGYWANKVMHDDYSTEKDSLKVPTSDKCGSSSAKTSTASTRSGRSGSSSRSSSLVRNRGKESPPKKDSSDNSRPQSASTSSSVAKKKSVSPVKSPSPTKPRRLATPPEPPLIKKDYRKSILNMNDKEAEEVLKKKKEGDKRQELAASASSKKVLQAPSESSTTTTSSSETDTTSAAFVVTIRQKSMSPAKSPLPGDKANSSASEQPVIMAKNHFKTSSLVIDDCDADNIFMKIEEETKGAKTVRTLSQDIVESAVSLEKVSESTTTNGHSPSCPPPILPVVCPDKSKWSTFKEPSTETSDTEELTSSNEDENVPVVSLAKPPPPKIEETVQTRALQEELPSEDLSSSDSSTEQETAKHIVLQRSVSGVKANWPRFWDAAEPAAPLALTMNGSSYAPTKELVVKMDSGLGHVDRNGLASISEYPSPPGSSLSSWDTDSVKFSGNRQGQEEMSSLLCPIEESKWPNCLPLNTWPEEQLTIGQVMLYVDEMNGVIKNNETVQWFYSLISAKYRLVVKTALKLLLAFVESTESNCLLLIQAVDNVDTERGAKPWTNIMNLLHEENLADAEMLTSAMALINRTLAGLADQDSYYDLVDCLEEQGMERLIEGYRGKPGLEADILEQFDIYEANLKLEDGDSDGGHERSTSPVLGKGRGRARLPSGDKRRRSRRHSVGPCIGGGSKLSIYTGKVTTDLVPSWHKKILEQTQQFSNLKEDKNVSLNGCTKITKQANGSTLTTTEVEETLKDIASNLNGTSNSKQQLLAKDSPPQVADTTSDMFPTPPVTLRPRPQHLFPSDHSDYNLRAQRASISSCSSADSYGSTSSGNSSAYSLGSTKLGDLNQRSPPLSERLSLVEQRKRCLAKPLFNDNCSDSGNGTSTLDKYSELNNKRNLANGQSIYDLTTSPSANGYGNNNKAADDKNSWMLNGKAGQVGVSTGLDNGQETTTIGGKNIQSPVSPKNWAPISNATPLISPTKESISGSSIGVRNIQELILNNQAELISSKSKSSSGWSDPNVRSPLSEGRGWDNTTRLGARPLHINDLDFSDLKSDDDLDILAPPPMAKGHPSPSMMDGSAGPPPPPMMAGMIPPPPPPPGLCGTPPPPPLPLSAPPSSVRGPGSHLPLWLQQRQQSTPSPTPSESKLIPKNKKTVKLFWKEVKEEKSLLRLTKKKTIWDEIRQCPVDTGKLEHLFENRSKELVSKKQQEGKKTEIILLDTKRSNAINIGMTKLPPPRTIRTAIMRMDATIINREGIEKILSTMMPTEEEKNTILEAQAANPDIPLGSAENFLLTLAQITALEARLKLWAFRLDYDILEKECAEQLMDLKQSITEVEKSETLRLILGTLLAVGNFLNGVEAKGFALDYLAKVPEVKDTVYKHSLLHHLCLMIHEKNPQSGDLYSELGAVTRASRVDYDELAKTLGKMDVDCKDSWEHLKVIAKHDGALSTMKARMSEFLANCAERINVLTIVQRRVHNRFKKLLVYLGFSSSQAKDLRPNQVLKVLSEFALEYRTTRERVKEQFEKANHREERKTRGRSMMITEADRLDKFPSLRQSKEQVADQRLREILGSAYSDYESDVGGCGWGAGLSSKRRLSQGRSIQNLYLASTGGCGGSGSSSLTGGKSGSRDDNEEILESLVKTATAKPVNGDQKTRRTKSVRYADRKSLRRTLKTGLDLGEEERLMLAELTS